MAKKKGGNKRVEEPDDDASVSSASTAYTTGRGPGYQMEHEDIDEVEAFQAAIDDTYESRGTTREKAWEGLTSMLRNEFRAEDCASSSGTVVSRALNSMRKGGALESQLAATAIGLCFLTLGEPDERGFQEVQADLERAGKHGKSPPAKVAALEALTAACWVASEDEHNTRATMQALQWHWRRESPKLQAAGVRNWSFLYTSLTAPLGAEVVEEALSTLSSLLHDQDVEVRSAAGEAIALLYHSSGLADIDEAEEYEEDAEGEVPEGMSETSAASTSTSGLELVMERMKDLATNRGDRQRRSRRERASLRSTFRGLGSVLDTGEVSETKIKMQHGDVMVISTLQGLVMVNWVRRFLAGGFQAHMQFNPLLHQVFQYSPLTERPGRLTCHEKRLYRSPGSAQSKARTQNRKSQRAHKDFGGEDW